MKITKFYLVFCLIVFVGSTTIGCTFDERVVAKSFDSHFEGGFSFEQSGIRSSSISCYNSLFGEKSFASSSSMDLSKDSPNSNYPETINVELSEADLIYSHDGFLTQGICSFENGFFISQRDASIPEDYHIYRIDLHDKMNISSTVNTFNHANGMAFNNLKNELYICKLSSSSNTTGCDRTCDYSFFVVDSLTFEIKQEIDLFNVVKDVCPDCIGISGIAYNNKTKKCYILSRRPKRYIVVLNEDFSYCDSFFICDDSEDILFGDIASFDEFIITCYWNAKGQSLSNVITIYDLKWHLLKVVELYGVTHIESIDMFDGRLIANFNDFSNGNDTKVFAIDCLHN